ncbi:MAG: VOC family protein [Haliea sp.]|nr:VOC family protein [Haliea sp.]
MSQHSKAHFGFTKLLVRDLEKSARFYTDVCGLTELARVEASIAGRPIREIMFNTTGEGAAMFVLLNFMDDEGAPGKDVILGFQTDDVAAFVQRAVDAGGKIVDPVRDDPEHGVMVGFVSDPEGHLIEVVQVTEQMAVFAH